MEQTGQEDEEGRLLAPACILPNPSCVTLGELPDLSEPCFQQHHEMDRGCS